MSTTTLKNEIQSRVNSVTHPIAAKELLKIAIETIGLDLDLSNIISVLNTTTSSVGSSTSDSDLLALNSASIALGVTNKPNNHTCIMPYQVLESASLRVVRGGGGSYHANQSNFYTELEQDFSDRGFETAVLSHATNTSEQTIVDSGTGVSGVLTHVKSPSLSASGDMVITVTVDGVEHAFKMSTIYEYNEDRVLCVGDFLPFAASGTNAVNYGTGQHSSYGLSDISEGIMLSPTDCLSRGLPIGLVFKDSLKVTFQSSVDPQPSSVLHKAAAAWLTYIPVGVE